MPDLSAMKRLRFLYARHNQIDNFGALATASYLGRLFVDYNNLKDLALISRLPKLLELSLTGNGIVDVSPLKSMVDVDGLDPSQMPATGTPVPGGLGYYQALRLVEHALKGRKCVGFDVVELAPDGNAAWDFTAAQIVYRLMAAC